MEVDNLEDLYVFGRIMNQMGLQEVALRVPQAHAEPLVQQNHHGTSTVKPPRQTYPQAHADEQHKHHMNQMVVYKNSLRYP